MVGISTTYIYISAGELATVTDALKCVVKYTYDKNNRPVSSSDGNGNVTSYVYDRNGNLTEIHNPDGGIEKYTYDLNDQMTSYTGGEGYTYTYDTLKRVTSVFCRENWKKYVTLSR